MYCPVSFLKEEVGEKGAVLVSLISTALLDMT